MYLNFFDFNRQPFNVTPDAELLFLSPTHREALEAIIDGVEKRLGIIHIAGDTGLGKTTVLRSYLECVEKQNIKITVFFHPSITFAGLLKTIYQNLDREFPGIVEDTEAAEHFLGVLEEEYRSNRNVVVILDEAHNIPVQTLEHLVLLANLDRPQDNRFQIVLVGQPELDLRLKTPRLRQLKKNIALRTEILPLSPAESAEYISFRLSKASDGNDMAFSRAAVRRVVKFCKGIPRIMNMVCDNSLMTAFRYKIKPVSRTIVDEVIRYHYGRSTVSRKRMILVGTAAGLAMLAVWLLWPLWAIMLSKSLDYRSGPGPVVYEDHLSPIPPKNTKPVPKVEEVAPTPAMSAIDPAPAAIPPRPAMQTPKVQTPGTQTPKVQTLDVQAPSVQTPKMQTLDVQAPGVRTPGVTPSIEPPNVQTAVKSEKVPANVPPVVADKAPPPAIAQESADEDDVDLFKGIDEILQERQER